VAWDETTDAAELWRRAGTWLGEHPVENAPLLAEVAHLLAAGAAPAGLACGWWSEDDGAVRGAYVGLPRHTPLLTRMPRAALDELPSRLGPAGGVGVPAAIVDDIVEAWAAAGTRLVPGRVFTVHVLDGTPGPPAAVGHARVAGPDDRALLHRWFDQLMAGLPGDPSDRAFVVDEPLATGAMVLWEVDDRPVAMCGRSGVLADTMRMGACYAPGGEVGHVEAVFAAAVLEARHHASNVTVLAGADDEGEAARLAASGFVAKATRVALTARDDC